MPEISTVLWNLAIGACGGLAVTLSWHWGLVISNRELFWKLGHTFAKNTPRCLEELSKCLAQTDNLVASYYHHVSAWKKDTSENQMRIAQIESQAERARAALERTILEYQTKGSIDTELAKLRSESLLRAQEIRADSSARIEEMKTQRAVVVEELKLARAKLKESSGTDRKAEIAITELERELIIIDEIFPAEVLTQSA